MVFSIDGIRRNVENFQKTNAGEFLGRMVVTIRANPLPILLLSGVFCALAILYRSYGNETPSSSKPNTPKKEQIVTPTQTPLPQPSQNIIPSPINLAPTENANVDPALIPEQGKVEAIIHEFTTMYTIDEQKLAHNISKKYLERFAENNQAEISFVSHQLETKTPKFGNIKIVQDLDSEVFKWAITKGVDFDIQNDGKIPNQVVLYGVASQFNSSEAMYPVTQKPGKAVEIYPSDPTQGPIAQLQFPDQQVEAINDAANIGFNTLCYVLDEKTKNTVRHGYLTPQSDELAKDLITQLRKNGSKMEFLCIGSIPKGEENTEKVYEILVAAPAFGFYNHDLTNCKAPDFDLLGKEFETKSFLKEEIQFLCALHAYRAQFKQAIILAKLNPNKSIVFKPTTPGLGVFSNTINAVAKGFYIAAKEYESELKNNRVKVQLQVFQDKKLTVNIDSYTMAKRLGLKQL